MAYLKKSNSDLAKLFSGDDGEPDVLAFISMVDLSEIQDETLLHLVMAIRPLIAEIDARLVVEPEPPAYEAQGHFFSAPQVMPEFPVGKTIVVAANDSKSYDERHVFTPSETASWRCDRCGLMPGHQIHKLDPRVFVTMEKG